MIYQPDFVVMVDDSTEFGLIVEAILDNRKVVEVEPRIKRFMWGMRCPVGMIITPEKLRLYIDRMTSNSEQSIELLGEYESRDFLPWNPSSFSAPTDAAFTFEAAVQSWLEELPFRVSSGTMPVNLRNALEYYVVPTLLQGEVSAGRPRARIAS